MTPKNERGIAWILLDGSGVLFQMREMRRLEALRSNCSIHINAEQIRQRVWDSGLDGLFDYGYFREEQILEILRDKIGYKADIVELRRDWSKGFGLNAELLDYLRELKARHTKIKLAVLSDNGPLFRHLLYVTYRDEFAIFSAIVLSCDTGYCKPSRAAFESAFRQMNFTNSRSVLFVDDLEQNCEAAKLLGAKSVRFRSFEETRAEIERFVEKH